jgi:hypothetical protein
MKNIGTIKVAVVLLMLSIASLSSYASSGGTSLAGFFGAEAEKLVEKGWIVTSAWDLHNFLVHVYDNVEIFVLANPPIDSIKSFQAVLIRYIYPLFILAIVTTAAYLLLYSDSPKSRVKAKGILVRMIFAMIIISLSPLLTDLLLRFSGALTGAILNRVAVDSALSVTRSGAWKLFELFGYLTFIHRTGGIDLMLLWETFLLIFNFALAARYMLVIFWCMILPLTLLLYTFTPTKKIGKKFLHQTLLWVFVQVGWAFALMIVVISAATIDSIMPNYPDGKVGIAALMLMIGTPMALLGLMDWLSMGVEVIEIVNAAPLSIGALSIDEMKVERPVVTEEPALEGV